MICIIPARGGSTRLPGKNMIDFFGRPIIDWVIETAFKSRVFSAVIVSTDSEAIYSHIATTSAAKPVMRPPELCGDKSETDVLKSVMDSEAVDEACRIYPFAVLLTPRRIKYGLESFEEGVRRGLDAVIEVQQYRHPPQRGFTLDNQLKIEYIKPEGVEQRTQDLPVIYHDAGTFMFTTRGALESPLYGRDIIGLPVGEMEAQDIDEWSDLELAKMKFLRRGI